MDIYDFLPWLGIIGFPLTLLESFLLGEIFKIGSEFKFTWEVALLTLGFAITLVFFTSIAPFFIKRCSASMFNISLVSQIFWSYLVEIISLESSPKSYEYYLGFLVIIFGIYTFNKYSVIMVKQRSVENLSDTESIFKQKKCLNQKLLDNGFNDNIYDKKSETSSRSAFPNDKKISFYKNNTLSSRASKYLNNN